MDAEEIQKRKIAILPESKEVSSNSNKTLPRLIRLKMKKMVSFKHPCTSTV